MNTGQAAGEALGAKTSRHGITETLNVLWEQLDVDRISLHSIDTENESFRVVSSAGSDILADGTELPLDTSTQVLVPARGNPFRTTDFVGGDEAFDRPLDHLVMDMGFRSGCSIPLFMGSRPVGALCASSNELDFDPDPVLDALNEASLPMTLALNRSEASNARVVICIDDDLLAQGIARIVETTTLIDVETYSSTQALEESGRVGEPCEVVVCDVTFDGVPVDSFLASLRSSGTNSPALVLASKDSPMSRALALRGGAAAYVARSAGVDRLAATVRDLMAGEAGGIELPVADGDDAEIPHLTGQEAKILALLERGLRFKQIALELGISESTAKGYARNLFSKLDAHSRAEAVHIARNRGLLDFLVDIA